MSVFASASAQSPDPPRDGKSVAHGPPPDGRANVLRELGLSREQAQEIRRINQSRRDALDAANRRVREANRALDEAIYADKVDDAVYQTRLAGVQAAHSAAAALRFEKELAIRRVLTPEQLVRFRELRRKFDELRQTIEDRRRERRGPPIIDGPLAPTRQFMKQGRPRQGI